MDKINMASENIKLSIPSHPKYLQLVRGAMEKATRIIGFSEDGSGHIILAVDEACSNIIKHSYMNDPKGKIDISIEIHGKELKIHITDYGKQCDIRQMQSRDIEDIRPGGLGIYIINQVMDSVEYDCSSASQNQVIMIKRMEAMD
jgi:anti-sigma regulatory factor (Ser/Thr protein kinase)